MDNTLGLKIAGHGTTWRDGLTFIPEYKTLVVLGGAALAVELHDGDRLILRDREGGQPIQILADRKSLSKQNLEISEDIEETPITEGMMKAMGYSLTPAHIKTIKNFDEPMFFWVKTRDVELDSFTSQSLIIISAMPPKSDLPAGPIDAFLRRQSAEADKFILPDPLTEMKDDFTIKASTGKAYEIKAGDFIQIIDGQGRQCTDFLAFSRDALDRGKERFVDGTATRSMIGSAYPQPGSASKFFDQDLTPLIEVMHDSCGRHDTFGHACTSRTYQLAGYPDHDNCSDNISYAMAPYGVERRATWPAVNYFFNTEIAANNQLRSDDGWSRPGDYILMRALTDLVCVSTSCADDLSPINGWNPTDIQIRVYDESQDFDRKSSFRTSVRSLPTMTEHSPLHVATSPLTRHYAAAKDMWIPSKYNGHGPVAEYWATQDAATIQDLSQIRKFDIAGPDSLPFVNYAFPRDMTRLDIGRCAYTTLLNHHGGVIDDGIIFRLNENLFRWTGGNEKDGDWLRQLAQSTGHNVVIRETSQSLANIAVQGPKAIEIIAPLFTTPQTLPTIEELKPFNFTHGQTNPIDGAKRSAVISATGYTGKSGVEIFASPQDAPLIWDMILTKGSPHGMIPMGLEGLELCRIEAGLAAADAEFDEHQTPYVAGLGFTIPLAKKSADFVGREACEKDKDNPRHRTVRIDIDGNWVPQQGAAIYDGESVIGHITSCCLSPKKAHAHGMARIVTTATNPSVEIGQLDNHMKRLSATLTL